MKINGKSTKSKTVEVNRFIAKMVNDFTNKTSMK